MLLLLILMILLLISLNLLYCDSVVDNWISWSNFHKSLKSFLSGVSWNEIQRRTFHIIAKQSQSNNIEKNEIQSQNKLPIPKDIENHPICKTPHHEPHLNPYIITHSIVLCGLLCNEAYQYWKTDLWCASPNEKPNLFDFYRVDKDYQ